MGGQGCRQSFTAVPLHVDSHQSETLRYIVHLQAFVSFTLPSNPICKTLEIFLPARLPEVFHSFTGARGVINFHFTFQQALRASRFQEFPEDGPQI